MGDCADAHWLLCLVPCHFLLFGRRTGLGFGGTNSVLFRVNLFPMRSVGGRETAEWEGTYVC